MMTHRLFMAILLFVFFLLAFFHLHKMNNEVGTASVYTLKQFSKIDIRDGGGAYLYAGCNMCHGFDGDGSGYFELLSPSLQKQMPDFTKPDGFWWVSRRAIEKKIKKSGNVAPHMIVYDGLTDKQVGIITTFVLSRLISAELTFQGKARIVELCAGGDPLFIKTDVPIDELLIAENALGADSSSAPLIIDSDKRVGMFKISSPWFFPPLSRHTFLKITQVEDDEDEDDRLFSLIPIHVYHCL